MQEEAIWPLRAIRCYLSGLSAIRFYLSGLSAIRCYLSGLSAIRCYLPGLRGNPTAVECNKLLYKLIKSEKKSNLTGLRAIRSYVTG